MDFDTFVGIEEVIDEVTDVVCLHYGIKEGFYGSKQNKEIPTQTKIKIK